MFVDVILHEKYIIQKSINRREFPEFIKRIIRSIKNAD